MLTDDQLFSFAKTCASTYCRRHNCARQLDDARQNAAVFLLSRRDLWEQNDAYLIGAVEKHLIRIYQNAAGLRRKSRLVQSGTVSDKTPDKRDDLARLIDREEAAAIVKRAANNSRFTNYLPVLLDLADGLTQEQAADKYGIPRWLVSKIFCEFAFELRKIDTERGVKLVEPRNIDGSTPLFGDCKK